jgi:hypothetical protein
MNGLRFEITIDQVTPALAAAPQVFEEELYPSVLEAELLLEREVRERTPSSGAGTLRDSIGALPVTFSGLSFEGGVGTALSYAAPVELGSRPHRPPVEPIAEWVARKLGKRGQEGRKIAWAIAGKIARDGTPARFMFRDGLAATQDQILEILAAGAGRAIARLGA